MISDRKKVPDAPAVFPAAGIKLRRGNRWLNDICAYQRRADKKYDDPKFHWRLLRMLKTCAGRHERGWHPPLEAAAGARSTRIRLLRHDRARVPRAWPCRCARTPDAPRALLSRTDRRRACRFR